MRTTGHRIRSNTNKIMYIYDQQVLKTIEEISVGSNMIVPQVLQVRVKLKTALTTKYIVMKNSNTIHSNYITTVNGKRTK